MTDHLIGSGRALTIRPARLPDVPALAGLMIAYMRETYGCPWHGSEEALTRDAFGRDIELQVAEAAGGTLVGLAAWKRAYDLHHCITGGEVIDMFVAPGFRTRNIGPALVCAVAAEIVKQGGVFLRGQAVDDPRVRRLYGRVAMVSANVECTVGGRAFRRLASLSGAGAREMARSLPPISWNYER